MINAYDLIWERFLGHVYPPPFVNINFECIFQYNFYNNYLYNNLRVYSFWLE